MEAGGRDHQPDVSLGQQHKRRIEQLPGERHAENLELHQIQLRPAVQLLCLVLLHPVRELVADPAVPTRGQDAEKVRHLKCGAEVVKDRHDEEQAAHKAAVIVLHAILPRVRRAVNLLSPLWEELLQGIPEEGPGAPADERAEPLEGVGGATRPTAVGPVGALRDVVPKVTQVHLACDSVVEVCLLLHHLDKETLDQDSKAEEEVTPNDESHEGH
mmetsp:Transcript_110928/g.347106  ORF Transcript_110928/g.347106 Transcript_110928/m.347106 type:complete len:215 (-) Transcript_110928:261-905(-)